MPGRHAGIAPAGINIDWQNPKGDPFWINEPIALMQALVLYSSRHLKDICDIPHIFSFAAHSSEEEIAKLVSKDVDYSNYAASFTSALAKKDVGGQVAGVWSGIKSVARKASVGPLIMWVLSGDEVDFNLNRPEQPTLLCIVNNSLKQKVIAPFVLLVATVCRTTMNVKKRHKSIFLLDEAPTLYLPEFDQLPNTGRSNKIAKEIANKLIRLRAHSMV
ncbi:MAG: type IV secretory system conjugative DNA transfer family protein [Prevotellaceae bacterium]|nr:type IV secretory system conjugative DNA transfer family protein [Prevotellaceae bacterium]